MTAVASPLLPLQSGPRCARRLWAAAVLALLAVGAPQAQAPDPALAARPIDPVSLAAAKDNEWRRPDFEVYRWEAVPGFLILDTRTYEVQQRLFHRLAFFVEKAGHVGRIEDYEQIAGLKGYFAHNYYNEDVAHFLNVAEQSGVALLPEEEQLAAILLANGSLRRRVDRYEPTPGGILSISREAGTALRRLHTHHELSHAVFYLDRSYAREVRGLWASLPPDLRQFFRLFLAWNEYDISDGYLLVNEFQGWVLHNNPAGVEDYFRKFAEAQLKRDLPLDLDTYRAIGALSGQPFRELHQKLREAMTRSSPVVARKLDALR